MKKLTFKNKFYILLALMFIVSLIVDIFNIIELNRYNGLMGMLLLTILFCGIQYRAAKKGLDTMLSISREYYIRKLWNIEDQFDWETTRQNHIKWSPICIGITLMQIIALYFTGDKYTVVLVIIWVINIMLYAIFTRALKYRST